MLDFLKHHGFCSTAVVYWIFSAAVSSLPEPTPTACAGYIWLFRFLHTIAGNLSTAFGNRLPGIKILGMILILPLLFSSTACGMHYAVHPGALNTVDSAAYDALLVAETTIDQARLDMQNGTLPDSARSALNALISTYNVARGAWLTYRSALGAGLSTDAYFAQLNQGLTALTAALKQFEEAK